MVFDKMGKLINKEDVWMKRFEELKEYISQQTYKKTIEQNIQHIILKYFSKDITSVQNELKINRKVEEKREEKEKKEKKHKWKFKKVHKMKMLLMKVFLKKSLMLINYMNLLIS